VPGPPQRRASGAAGASTPHAHRLETKRDGAACVPSRRSDGAERGVWADAHMRVPICRQRPTASECAKCQRGSSLPYFGPTFIKITREVCGPWQSPRRQPRRSLNMGRLPPGLWSPKLQRADEVLFAHKDGAVAGVDDVDRASWGCPVGRGDGQDLLDEVSQRPASVRLEVSSARRRMIPSQATSVITTLTQTSLPASARETASHLWQRQECRKVQRDPRYALRSPAVVAEHPRMRATPNIRGAPFGCLGQVGHGSASSGHPVWDGLFGRAPRQLPRPDACGPQALRKGRIVQVSCPRALIPLRARPNGRRPTIWRWHGTERLRRGQ